MDGGVIDERVVRLRDAREKTRVGVEAQVEEKHSRRTECPCAARLEHRVRVVVYQEARAEDRGCCVERGEDERAEERRGER